MSTITREKAAKKIIEAACCRMPKDAFIGAHMRTLWNAISCNQMHFTDDSCLRTPAKYNEICGMLRELAEAIQQKVEELKKDQPGPSTEAEVLAELEALESNYDDVRYTDEAVIVTTDDIKFGDVELGRFDIHLYYTDVGKDYFTVVAVALTPNPHHDSESTTHPHVQDGGVCMGEGEEVAWDAARELRVLDYFDIVWSVLHTYAEDSPYKRIEDWLTGGYDICALCGSETDSADMYSCESCGTNVCEDCRWSCGDCGESICSDCHISCSCENNGYCGSCQKDHRCPDCSTTICDSCSTDCHVCDRTLCGACTTECEGCKENTCKNCLITCVNCRGKFCKSCVKGVLCEDCFSEAMTNDEENEEESEEEHDRCGEKTCKCKQCNDKTPRACKSRAAGG